MKQCNRCSEWIADPDLVCKWCYFKKIKYEPHKAQRQFHASDRQFKSMFGGSGLGKSMSAAREAEPVALEPGRTIWIVGPTYELAKKEFDWIWLDFQNSGLMKLATRRMNDSHGRMIIEFPWNTTIQAKSAENPDSLLGTGVDLLILGEGARLPDLVFDRYLLRAVHRQRGRVVCNTTPYGFNWIYDRLFVPGQPKLEDGSPNPRFEPERYWSGLFGVLDNPYYPVEAYEFAESHLPHEIFEEQYQGRFVRFSGLIYKEFDREGHVFDPTEQEIPRHWGRVIGYDHGASTSHNTAILFGAIDEHGRLWIYDEFVDQGGTIGDYADIIKSRITGLPLMDVRVDSSAKQIIIDLAHMDVPAQPCEKGQGSVFAGIVRVQNFFKNRALFISKKCQRLIWELQRYAWDEDDKTGRKPKKKDDDAVDALRYLLSAIPEAAEPVLLQPEAAQRWEGLDATEQFAWRKWKDLADRKELEKKQNKEEYWYPDESFSPAGFFDRWGQEYDR